METKKIVSREEQLKGEKFENLDEKMREKEREVNEIEKTLVSLGKNLGWPQEDHKDFISIWHRGGNSKNYFQIEEELQGYFAFYTGQQIQEHMNKYMKYRKLTEEKKELIIEYKNLKEARKIQELKGLELERNQSRERREKQEQKRRNQKEQQQMKVRVAEWKEMKIKEKQEEEERKVLEQIKKKQENAEKKKEIEERNKDILNKWKQQETQKKQ